MKYLRSYSRNPLTGLGSLFVGLLAVLSALGLVWLATQ